MGNTDWQDDETFLARWMADDVSSEEKEAFEASEEGQFYLSLKQASDSLEPPTYSIDHEWLKLKAARENVPKESRQVRFTPAIQWSVAASLILLIGAFYLFSGGKTIRSGNGQHQLAKLPDGSEVRLNSGSVLNYEKWNWLWSREVELEEGEAFFKVTEGSKFQVATEHGYVTVLGTSFNVKNRNGKLYVTCFSGEVLVTSGELEQRLNQGMGIVVERGQIIDRKAARIRTEPEWMSGIIRLKKVTFRQALEELERTFNLSIENQAPELDTIKFTGSFPNQVESALKLVLEPLNISYSFEADTRKLTIIGRNE